ncbi:hypothetical protein D3C86_1721190 [compost metagenome]
MHEIQQNAVFPKIRSILLHKVQLRPEEGAVTISHAQKKVQLHSEGKITLRMLLGTLESTTGFCPAVPPLLHTEIIPVDLELLQHSFFGQLAAEITLDAAG